MRHEVTGDMVGTDVQDFAAKFNNLAFIPKWELFILYACLFYMKGFKQKNDII